MTTTPKNRTAARKPAARKPPARPTPPARPAADTNGNGTPASTAATGASGTVREVVRRLVERPVVVGAVAAVVVGLLVLLGTELRGERHEARVGLLAGPVAPAAGAAPQYGEVVSLTLPALVELARSPSVLGAAAEATGLPSDELADGVAVELVPASGLARLSVHAPSAEQAGLAVTAIARAMIDADLLAPAGALRLLDERPDVTRVAPDRPLGLGLALVAAAVAGVSAGAVRHLRRSPSAVRTALAAGGVRHPVATLAATDPELTGRLRALSHAADRPMRVVPVTPDLVARAEQLAETAETIESTGDPSAGTAVVLLAPAGRRQDGLAAVVGVLPGSAVVVAVVLA